MGNKVIKSISFNITNESDQECLERVKEVNFSGYVKGLILADIHKSKTIRKSEGGGIKIVLG